MRFLNWIICLFLKPKPEIKQPSFDWVGPLCINHASKTVPEPKIFMACGDTITFTVDGIPGKFTATALEYGCTSITFRVGLQWVIE